LGISADFKIAFEKRLYWCKINFDEYFEKELKL
jgi:hypothetical protein